MSGNITVKFQKDLSIRTLYRVIALTRSAHLDLVGKVATVTESSTSNSSEIVM